MGCNYLSLHEITPSGPKTWWRHQMETFSALLAICVGNSLVTGEFPTQWPVTWSFDVFLDLCLNKRLSKQSGGWWFEMPSCSLWRHCNVLTYWTHAGHNKVGDILQALSNAFTSIYFFFVFQYKFRSLLLWVLKIISHHWFRWGLWHWTGDKLLSEPMVKKFREATRPQWVNASKSNPT